MFTWQTKIIVLLLAAGVAFGGGWKTRDAFCDAAAAKLEVANLKTQLEAFRKAAEADASRAEEDAKAREILDEKVRELATRISDGQCLSPADTDELRRLWPTDTPRARTR